MNTPRDVKPPLMVVLGAGSVGCYLGGLLVKGGARVSFIGRDKYAAQIAAHGLMLTHFEREPLTLPRIDFRTDYEGLRGADIILCCTKSQDTEDAAKAIAAYARDTVQVISFQNGIRNPELLQSCLPKADIVPAIVPFNITPSGPGRFHCGVTGALIVGRNIHPAVVKAFIIAGQPLKAEPDILAAQWAKMIVNLNNALNALSGKTLRECLLQRDYRLALALVVEEALSVAKANGITPSTFNGRKAEQLIKTLRLPNFMYKIVMQLIVKIDAKARSSMLDDLEAGRMSEIDYLQGEIVRHANMAGIAAPYNARILKLTQSAFAAGVSPHMSGEDILKALTL